MPRRHATTPDRLSSPPPPEPAPPARRAKLSANSPPCHRQSQSHGQATPPPHKPARCTSPLNCRSPPPPRTAHGPVAGNPGTHRHGSAVRHYHRANAQAKTSLPRPAQKAAPCPCPRARHRTGPASQTRDDAAPDSPVQARCTCPVRDTRQGWFPWSPTCPPIVTLTSFQSPSCPKRRPCQRRDGC